MTTYLIIGVVLIALIVLSRRKHGSTRIRIGPVVEDLEARLRPLSQEGPTWMATGKAHRERFQNGRELFDVRVRGLRMRTGAPRLQAGDVLHVVLDGKTVAQMVARRDHFGVTLDSSAGDAVPVSSVGSEISIEFNGQTLLQGVFELD